MIVLKTKEEILKELNLYSISDRAYSDYTNKTKDNEYLTRDEVVRKLYRNILLSVKNTYWGDKTGKKFVYYYGNMNIIVNDNRIVSIKNNRDNAKSWYKDKVAYNYLNDILKIYY